MPEVLEVADVVVVSAEVLLLPNEEKKENTPPNTPSFLVSVAEIGAGVAVADTRAGAPPRLELGALVFLIDDVDVGATNSAGAGSLDTGFGGKVWRGACKGTVPLLARCGINARMADESSKLLAEDLEGGNNVAHDSSVTARTCAP